VVTCVVSIHAITAMVVTYQPLSVRTSSYLINSANKETIMEKSFCNQSATDCEECPYHDGNEECTLEDNIEEKDLITLFKE